MLMRSIITTYCFFYFFTSSGCSRPIDINSWMKDRIILFTQRTSPLQERNASKKQKSLYNDRLGDGLTHVKFRGRERQVTFLIGWSREQKVYHITNSYHETLYSLSNHILFKLDEKYNKKVPFSGSTNVNQFC